MQGYLRVCIWGLAVVDDNNGMATCDGSPPIRSIQFICYPAVEGIELPARFVQASRELASCALQPHKVHVVWASRSYLRILCYWYELYWATVKEASTRELVRLFRVFWTKIVGVVKRDSAHYARTVNTLNRVLTCHALVFGWRLFLNCNSAITVHVRPRVYSGEGRSRKRQRRCYTDEDAFLEGHSASLYDDLVECKQQSLLTTLTEAVLARGDQVRRALLDDDERSETSTISSLASDMAECVRLLESDEHLLIPDDWSAHVAQLDKHYDTSMPELVSALRQ